jgi:hypothetical protein
VLFVEQRLVDIRIQRLCAAAAAAAAAADGEGDDGGGDGASEASSIGMSVSYFRDIYHHMLHVTRHTLHVTRHTSHATGGFSFSKVLDNLGHKCFEEIAGAYHPPLHSVLHHVTVRATMT